MRAVDRYLAVMLGQVAPSGSRDPTRDRGREWSCPLRLHVVAIRDGTKLASYCAEGFW